MASHGSQNCIPAEDLSGFVCMAQAPFSSSSSSLFFLNEETKPILD